MSTLESENVIVEAPLSFTGATKRIWRITDNDNPAVKWLIAIPVAVFSLSIAYAMILCWYVLFGILLIPYRLLRRSQRKNKRNELRHRETLDALNKTKI